MIELGKYGAYILSAYTITLVILLSLVIQTSIDFFKTKNKLNEISQEKF